MPRPSEFDPLALLLAGHKQTRQQLGVLGSANGAQVITWFDHTASQQREILESGVFPALIESMAGSDAVCLKGMTRGLTEQSHVLAHQWPAIRQALQTPGQNSEATQRWIQDYLTYLQCADEDLLPMAQRLLDDAALQDIEARYTQAFAQS
ncbi:hemerythrin domain-containing protein [Castellaniella sp. FW104-16D08]|uniref:hemerythrin domain-containing protein n=1 Tax=unclassified Castellaniella TaxID=2617606 RepID=UPI003314A01B